MVVGFATVAAVFVAVFPGLAGLAGFPGVDPVVPGIAVTEEGKVDCANSFSIAYINCCCAAEEMNFNVGKP